ncbi:DnaJ domain-containing protein [Quillaja saponaria]|uniref:DnaJ domain-containing protein n=1 Tax=Quillaja saponaria TaxID=32244 RepID=A0AAD7P691_QUISA|nr:DnaJ domain-containing protein [Quillaja saponaria]
MERESTGPVSESKKLLALSVELLGSRDFTSCRRLALRVQKSDPEISVTVNRIIAIADVLKASKRRLPNKIHDWYSILQLRRVDCENCHIIRTQFKNLLHLLNPNKNKFPFSEEAFMLVRNAWFVLSDPGKKAKYESEIDKEQEICNQREDKQESFVIEQMGRYKENGSDSNATFWTVCPYCWNLYEYEKVYEECGLRCQNCKKAFHGVAVNAPAPEMLVEGKEQYYCCHGYFRMRYSGPQHKAVAEKQKEMTNKKEKNVGENGAGKVFVEISDDDSDDSFNGCGNGEQRKGGAEEKVKVEGLHEKVVKNVSNEAQGTVKSDGHGVMEGSGMSKLRKHGQAEDEGEDSGKEFEEDNGEQDEKWEK